MPRLAGIAALLLVSGGLLLAGCADKGAAPGGAVPGVRHNEPVIYNNQRYVVSYRFDESASAYAVAVARPGKALGKGDGETARQVAQSTVTYYACPSLSKTTWHMQVKCT